MLIYLVINTVNGKEYIGYTTKSLEKRRYEHIWRSSHGSEYAFHAAIRKYGEHKFVWVVLEDNIDSFAVLEKREQFWIKTKNTKSPNGYNLTEGGGGNVGYIPSEEARKNISRAQTGRKHSEETKRKISQSHIGIRPSEETLKKLSASHKGAVVSAETRKKQSIARMGHPGYTKGIPMSEETKRKISLALVGNKYAKGFIHSKETRKKLSIAHKRYWAAKRVDRAI